MGKRTRHEDDNQFLNHGKRTSTRRRVASGGYDDDFFDRLPDDIVIQILERLNLRDVAKTSILSQRFLGLWKLLIQYRKNLDFQGLTAQEPKNFEKFVNGVMHRHKGPSVDSLSIAISKPYDSFKEWLRFGRARRVKNLEIEFSFMASRMGISLYGWDKLTSLTLRFVQVERSHLKRWLKKSLINLESLYIEGTLGLRSLKVSSQSLKRLELRDCHGLDRVYINFAPNLEFFKKMDSETFSSTELYIKDAAPKLSHVSLTAHLFDYKLSDIHKAGVEKLELHIGYWVEVQGIDWTSDEYPRLGDVKELKITFPIEKWSRFFFLILSLILPACPQLKKLMLYCNHSPNQYWSESKSAMLRDSEKAKLRARSSVHECLKVVEFGGWSGWEDEVQGPAANLVKEIAPNLEKITYV